MKCDNVNKFPCFQGCYIIGPTGPTGPQGQPSAKISIGTTTTSEPGASAEVYSTGTGNDIILNFVIPRGVMGPMPNIIVGDVLTGDAGTLAQVTITPINGSNNK